MRALHVLTFCFHLKFSIEYGNQETKSNTKINHEFSNRFYECLMLQWYLGADPGGEDVGDSFKNVFDEYNFP